MKALLKKMLQSMASAAAGPMHREIIQNLANCETEIRSLQRDMRALTMKVDHPFFTKEGKLRDGLEFLTDAPKLRPPWEKS